MKRIFAIVLCFVLLGAMLLPVTATESTTDTLTTGNQAAAQRSNGSHVMAIVCGVLAVAGVLYLVFTQKRTK